MKRAFHNFSSVRLIRQCAYALAMCLLMLCTSQRSMAAPAGTLAFVHYGDTLGPICYSTYLSGPVYNFNSFTAVTGVSGSTLTWTVSYSGPGSVSGSGGTAICGSGSTTCPSTSALGYHTPFRLTNYMDTITITCSDGTTTTSKSLYVRVDANVGASVMNFPSAASIQPMYYLDRILISSTYPNATSFAWTTASGGVVTTSDTAGPVSNTSYTHLQGISKGLDTVLFTSSNSCGTYISRHAVKVDPIPNITSFSHPASVVDSPGLHYTLNGYFNPSATANIVYFGATRATVNSVTSSPTGSMDVTLPLGASLGRISVTDSSSNYTGYSKTNVAPVHDSDSFFPDTLVNIPTALEMLDGHNQNLYHTAFADLNGDGKVDMVSVGTPRGAASPVMYVYINKSTHTNASAGGAFTDSVFAAPQAFACDYGSVNLKIGDIDGDGMPDIVVATNAVGSINIFKNATVGTTFGLRPKVRIGAINAATELTIGDFDGDGMNDIAVIGEDFQPGGAGPYYSGSLVIIHNNLRQNNDFGPATLPITDFASNQFRTDTIHTFTTYDFPNSVAAGDFDGDGRMDLVVSDHYQRKIFVFRNTGGGGVESFNLPLTLATNITGDTSGYPFQLKTADFNNDGYDDIAVCVGNSIPSAGDTYHKLRIFQNNFSTTGLTSGNFTASNFTAIDSSTGVGPIALAIGDLNGDRKVDIVVSNVVEGTISIFKNTSTIGGAISFAARKDMTADNTSGYAYTSAGHTFNAIAPLGVQIADLDNNMINDIVVSHQFSSHLSLLRNDILPDTSTIVFHNSDTVCVGLTSTYSVTGLKYHQNAYWSVPSSDQAVATIDSVSGILTGHDSGFATVYCYITALNDTTRMTVRHRVRVMPQPIAGGIVGNLNLCAGDSTTLVDTGSLGDTHIWTSSPTSVATINAATGVVHAILPTNATITYSTTNYCGTATTSRADTVRALANHGTLSGNPNLCTTTVGSSLFSTTAGGSWYSTNPGVATVVAGTGSVNGVSAGIDTMIYVVTNSCSSDTGRYVISVSSAVSPAPIVGADSVCNFVPSTYTSSATGGTWTVTGAGAGITSAGVLTMTSAGTATISYTFTSLCGDFTSTKAVVSRGIPTITTPISGSASVCMGTTPTFLDTVTSGGTGVAGVWSSSTSSVATINPSTGVLTPVGYGYDTIFFRVANGCGTVHDSDIIHVDTIPVLTAINLSTPSPLCGAVTSNATVVPAGAGSWILSNTVAATIGGASGLITAASITVAHVDTVTFTSTGCTHPSISLEFNVSPVPAPGPITGARCVSPSGTMTLSDTAHTTSGTPWSMTGAANINSVTGVVTAGASAGTAIASYSIVNSCGNITDTFSINVNPPASAGVLSGVNHVCTGFSTTITSTAAGGHWTLTGASGIAALDTTSSAGNAIVSGGSSGTVLLSYTASNICGSAVDTMTISVNPTPSYGTITGVHSVCASSSVTLSSTVTTGTWSSTSPGVSVTSLTGAFAGSGRVTGVTAGTDTVYYTVNSASCGNAVDTFLMTVDALPTVASITGTPSVCVSSNQPLSVSGGSGTVTFWSSSAPGTASVSATGVVTGASTGTAIISYTDSTACGSVSDTMLFTVNALPPTFTISGLHTVCVSSTVTLTSSVTTGSWSTSNSSVATAALSGTNGVVTGVGAGVDSIYYTVSTATCGNTVDTFLMTVNPLPSAATISGTPNVCQGSNRTLTVSGGSGATTFWSSSAPLVASVTAGGVVTGASVGTAIISYTDSTICGSVNDTMLFTVNALPNAGTITGASHQICIGSTLALTDAAGSGTWSVVTGNAAITALGVASGVTRGNDSIVYTVTTPLCGTARDTFAVNVDSNANAGYIVGASVLCSTSSTTLTDSAGLTGGTWSLSGTAASISPTTGVVTGSAAGTVVITYTSSTLCGLATATHTITVSNAIVDTIAGRSSICNSGSIFHTYTFTDATVSSHYLWTVSSLGGAATINSSTGALTGVSTGNVQITYIDTTACGPISVSKIVYIDTLPFVHPISGPDSVCVGSSILLTDADGPGAWLSSNPTLATVTSGGSVSGASGPGSPIISYSVTNECGTTTVTHVVNVAVSPTVPALTGVPSGTICQGTSFTVSDLVGGGTYSGGPTPFTFVPTGTSSAVVTANSGGSGFLNYTVNSYFSGCPATSVSALIVATGHPGAGNITGDTIVCTGATTTFADIAAGLTWHLTNTTRASLVTTSGGLGAAITGLSVGRDTAYVVATNACFTDRDSLVFYVHQSPSAGIIVSSDTFAVPNHRVCVDSPVAVTYLATGYIGDTLTWSESVPSESVLNIAPLTGNTTHGTGLSQGPAQIYFIASNICGSAIDTYNTYVWNAPDPGVVSGLDSICRGASATFVTTGFSGAWATTNSGIDTIDAGGVLATFHPGTDSVVYIASNPCGIVSAYHSIKVITDSPSAGTITGSNAMCLGRTIPLFDTVNYGGGVWASGTPTVATVDASGNVTGIALGSTNIYFIVHNTCATDSANYTVTVYGIPTLSSSLTPPAICDNNTFTYTATSAVPGATFAWTRAGVVGLSNAPASGIGNVSEVLDDTTYHSVNTIYSYVISANGCADTQSVTATVKPTPYLVGSPFADTICSNTTFSFVAVPTTPGTSMVWTRPAVPNISPATATGSGSILEFLANSTLLPINVVYNYNLSLNGCTNTDVVKLVVDPIPPTPKITTYPAKQGSTSADLCEGTLYQNFGTLTTQPAGQVWDWSASKAAIFATDPLRQYCLVNFTVPGVTAFVYLTAELPGFNCPVRDSFKVFVNTAVSDNPSVIRFQDELICLRADQDTYQWGYDAVSNTDSTLFPGETNQNYTVGPNPDIANKNYWVITTHNDCAQKTYYNPPVAVANITGSMGEVKVYPNPTSRVLTVEINNTPGGTYKVDVVNMLGQRVFASDVFDMKASMDVSELAAGCYFVDVYHDGVKFTTVKFVKN